MSRFLPLHITDIRRDTRDAVVAQGSGPRKLESAYLQITRATTEYVPGAGR